MRKKSEVVPRENGDGDELDRRKGFRFSPTLSWDSVAMIIGLAISGFLYIQTIKSDQALLAKDVKAQAETEAKDIAGVQRAIERSEAAAKEQSAITNKEIGRVEGTAKERSDRLEQVFKEYNKTLQDELVKLRR